MSDIVERLRERLAEADEANKRLSNENQRLRLLINEYVTSLSRLTNELLREIWAKEKK